MTEAAINKSARPKVRKFSAGTVAIISATTCMIVKKKANGKNWPYSGRARWSFTSSPQAYALSVPALTEAGRTARREASLTRKQMTINNIINAKGGARRIFSMLIFSTQIRPRKAGQLFPW